MTQLRKKRLYNKLMLLHVRTLLRSIVRWKRKIETFDQVREKCRRTSQEVD